MADKEPGKDKLEYSFEFKCADFELRFQGDFNFVQNQLRKYEPKILLKLNQLLPSETPPGLTSQSTLAPSQASAQKSSYGRERARYRDKHRGYKRPLEQEKKEEKNLSQERDLLEHQERAIEESAKTMVEGKRLGIDAGELRALLDRYHPRTLHDRVMLFAFYLAEKGGAEFGVSELQECYQALAEKSPANLYTVLNNAFRSGFLSKEEKSGKSRYRLSFKGKRYVENGLRLD